MRHDAPTEKKIFNASVPKDFGGRGVLEGVEGSLVEVVAAISRSQHGNVFNISFDLLNNLSQTFVTE